jgi:hypothetical protein
MSHAHPFHFMNGYIDCDISMTLEVQDQLEMVANLQILAVWNRQNGYPKQRLQNWDKFVRTGTRHSDGYRYIEYQPTT